MLLIPVPLYYQTKMENPKSAILIGAGNRGQTYAAYALKHPNQLRIVAVADPIQERRDKVARQHNIVPENTHQSWEDVASTSIVADGAIIATQDSMHVDPTLMALKKGMHVVLEKPMALTEADCLKLIEAAQKSGLTLNVCHVLRYTHFFSRVKQILDSGEIGDVITMALSENVSYHHMAHAYVRGNWGNSQTSSPMILAKCCHDLDLIQWFVGSRPVSVSSAGNLTHFTAQNAPDGAPQRCTDGCPQAGSCKFEAVDTYRNGKHMKLAIANSDFKLMALAAKLMLRFPGLAGKIPGLSRYRVWQEWPTSTITEDLTDPGIMQALKTGLYGRCVYFCDNDQVDHQETLIEFDNGATAVLKMHGHSAREGRTLRIDGSQGTLRGYFGGGGRLEVQVHATGEKKTYEIKTDLFGHAEGDEGIMENFVEVLNGETGATNADEALISHQLAFAAHEARLGNTIVKLG
jgi:predicted dehydrogenase